MTLVEQLRRDEGERLKPYRCTAGKLTIGVGRNLEDLGISREESEHLLQNDIARVTKELAARLPWTVTELSDARRGVLLNMAFNLGIEGLLAFRNTLDLVRKQRFAEAAAEMLDSLWAKQVGPRATRLAEQMRTGIWQ